MYNWTTSADKTDDEYAPFVIEKTESSELDSFFTQYLIMLGEFEIIENPPNGQQSKLSVLLLYFYFMIATFLANVLFYNVLVAVIGEAYTERWQKKHLYKKM